MGPTWGPPGSCRPQMGSMLAPWILLSGILCTILYRFPNSTVLNVAGLQQQKMPGKTLNSPMTTTEYIPRNIQRAYSRLVPSQWETALLCNDVSYWLGVSLESALYTDGSPFVVFWEQSILPISFRFTSLALRVGLVLVKQLPRINKSK